MVEAGWRGLLNSWQHWGAMSYNIAHKHTDAECTDSLQCVFTKSVRKSRRHERLDVVLRRGTHQKCSTCRSSWDEFIHLRDEGKSERKRKRSEARKRGERGQQGRFWTMVSNRRTLVQWWTMPFNNQSFWGGRRGGASCWQCQGPYQLVSASATETNDWATALLRIRLTHSQQRYEPIYILNTVLHAQLAELTQSQWQYTVHISV